MRNQLKLLMVVGVLALILPLLLGYAAGPLGAIHLNVIGAHQKMLEETTPSPDKVITNATCNGCHDPNNLDPNNNPYSGAHRRHFVSAFLNFYGSDPSTSEGCARCHYEAVYGGGVGAGLGSGYEGDLSYADSTGGVSTPGFPRAANKEVKAAACGSCHGAFNTSTAGHTGVTVIDTCVNAGSCHVSGGTGGDAGTEHAAMGVDSTSTGGGYINENFANSPIYCSRCHGDLQWFETTETTLALPAP